MWVKPNLLGPHPPEHAATTDPELVRAVVRDLMFRNGERAIAAADSRVSQLMLTIVADTCGRHDTIGGACSAESNTVRYSLDKHQMHSCRDSFIMALAEHDEGMSKRDLPSNINFFMNVPVTAEGGARSVTIAAGSK